MALNGSAIPEGRRRVPLWQPRLPAETRLRSQPASSVSRSCDRLADGAMVGGFPLGEASHCPQLYAIATLRNSAKVDAAAPSGKAHFRGGLPRGRDYVPVRAPQPDLVSACGFFADRRIQNCFAIAAPVATTPGLFASDCLTLSSSCL